MSRFALALVLLLLVVPAQASAHPLVKSLAIPTPRDVEVGYGSVWVANGPTNTVTRLDPFTNAVLARIPTPAAASVIAFGEGAVWVTSYPGNTLTRIDPWTNRATRTISLASAGAGAIGVTVFRGYVWVADHDGEPTTSVAKIDPVTMRVVDVIPVGPQDFAGPVWILSAAGSIWTDVDTTPNEVVRIDPRTDRIVATIPAPGACSQMAADDATVWVAGGDDTDCVSGVTRIDARTNRITAHIDTGASTDAIALGRRSLWFGNAEPFGLGKIDTQTNRIVKRVDVPGEAFGIAVGAGAVWATDRPDNLLFKVTRR